MDDIISENPALGWVCCDLAKQGLGDSVVIRECPARAVWSVQIPAYNAYMYGEHLPTSYADENLEVGLDGLEVGHLSK